MAKIRFLSLFSGIEAASQAWLPLGFECVAVSEIDPFCCALLAHHYPDVPNLGDVSMISEAQIKALGRIDIVVFGSPCQDLSVAGKRQGLSGSRSCLFYHAMRIINYAKKHNQLRFALWENVKGALSSQQGYDFAAVACALSDLPPPPQKGKNTHGKTQAPCLVSTCLSGALWMRSTLGSPKDAKECSLWQTLECGKIDRQYYLSPKACAGLLQRAIRRGKVLPNTLVTLLQQQSAIA